MHLEHSDIYDRVLDQELPRSIDGAKELLIRDCWEAANVNAKNSEAFDWPLVQSFKASLRSEFADFPKDKDARTDIEELMNFREMLGYLTTSYEISGYEPFATRADAALGEAKNIASRCFGASKTRFTEETKDTYYFDRLPIVEIILSASKLEESEFIEISQIRSFKRFVRACLERTESLTEHMQSCDDMREALAWALHCVSYSIYLDDKEALNRIVLICKDSIFPNSGKQLRALFKHDPEPNSIKAVGEWLESYLALAHCLQNESAVRQFCDLDIKMLVEQSLPLWGDTCNSQGDVLSADVVNLFSRRAIVFLLGMVSRELNFVQLWEDLTLVDRSALSNKQNIVRHPLLWIESIDFQTRPYSVDSKFSHFIDRVSDF